MADFICFEADASDQSNDEGDEMFFDDSLVDNSVVQENNEPSFFRFHNQTRDLQEVMDEIQEEEERAAEYMEANNYLEDCETEDIGNEAFDEFNNFEEKKELFLSSLKNPVENQTRENSFYLTLLYAIRFLKNKKSDQCDENEIENEIGADLYSKIKEKKDNLILDLNKRHFDEMCFDINEILLEENFFLRVYELKDKFRYLFHEDHTKKNVCRSLSSCIKEKFNGFTFADIKLAKKLKIDLVPVNILYKPVKKQDDVLKCYFTDDLQNAFRALYLKSQQVRAASTLYECFYCNEFFLVKSIYEKHVRDCGKKPGVLYDFNLKNIVTFEDNIKHKGDVPFCVYADFETTAPTDDYLNPENKPMTAVSYSLIFAWHPKLSLARQMVVRGYNHSLDELSDITYLTSGQLAMRNQTTTRQLQDAILNVHSKRKKNAIAEMFNIELKFACDILMCWFNEEFKKPQTNLDNQVAIDYRRAFPITVETKCVICDFSLEVDPKGLEYKENDMSYLNFLIRKEYAFLRNIFDEDDLKQSKSICNLKTYWDKMKLYIHLLRVSEMELKSAYCYSDINDELLKNFLMEYYDAYEYKVDELIEEEIKKFEVKYNKKMKMPKFTLQLYSFLYDCLMDFPEVKFDEIKTITTNAFMQKLHRIYILLHNWICS